MPECGYNQVREEAMKRQMDAMQDNSTANMVSEKIAAVCKTEQAKSGHSKRVVKGRTWEQFINQP